MKDWGKAIERNKATYDFCSFLNDPANATIRQALIVTEGNWNNAQLAAEAYRRAKETFADKGDIAIPDDVEVRVYEEDRFPRDRLVTIVLAPPGSALPTWPRWDVFKYYRCTWSPWSSLAIKVFPPGDRHRGRARNKGQKAKKGGKSRVKKH